MLEDWERLSDNRYRHWMMRLRTMEGACLTITRWRDGLWRVHYMDTGDEPSYTHYKHEASEAYERNCERGG